MTILVLLTIGTGIGIYAKRDQVYKEHLLISELMTLRNYLMIFFLERKKFPTILAEIHQIEKDPFGRLYFYDSKKGWVSSQTPGYINW